MNIDPTATLILSASVWAMWVAFSIYWLVCSVAVWRTVRNIPKTVQLLAPRAPHWAWAGIASALAHIALALIINPFWGPFA